MHAFRFAVVVVYLAGVVLLVLGHWFGDLRPAMIPDAPAFAAADNSKQLTIWVPPHREFELLALTSDPRRASGRDELEDNYVRPAWFTFAAAVALFLYIWTNTEHARPRIDILPLY